MPIPTNDASQLMNWPDQKLDLSAIGFSAPKTSKKKVVKSTVKGEHEIYTVKKGDSLWSISQKFKNVSVDKIKKWNNIWSAKGLKPGTKLKIFKS